MAKINKVQISNVNMGGIADSAYLGGKNSVADMLGFDIHSEAGVLKVNQALTKNSGSTIDDYVKAMIYASDGKAYMGGYSAGKIWSRDGGGTFTLEATNTNGHVFGMCEYQGYIYYASSDKLGRWQIGTAWSTRNDNWATFTVSTLYHPMLVLNGVLYIGDGYLLAQVDAGVFSANALDLETNFIIRCLGQMGTDLLMGTSNGIGGAQIFRWNTWSVSFTNSDPIPETIISAFLPMDNFVLVNAGYKGNIYIYDGSVLDIYKKVPTGLTSSSLSAIVEENAVLNFNGKALFGFQKLWSLARSGRNYPYVLNCEVGVSNGLNNVKIGAMCQPNSDYYLVAWYNTVTGVAGVDKYDTSLKYTGAYITSRIIMADRFELNTYGVTKIGWRTKPTGTEFTISTKRNNGSFIALTPATDQISDTDRNMDYAKADIGDATTLQVKVAVTVSSNSAPEIEAIEIGLNTID